MMMQPRNAAPAALIKIQPPAELADQIARILREQDRLHWYLSLSCKPAQMRFLFQLCFCLRAELTGLGLRITQPLLLQMRIAWWRERFEHLGKEELAHPLLQGFALLNKQNVQAQPALIPTIQAWFDVFETMSLHTPLNDGDATESATALGGDIVKLAAGLCGFDAKDCRIARELGGCWQLLRWCEAEALSAPDDAKHWLNCAAKLHQTIHPAGSHAMLRRAWRAIGWLITHQAQDAAVLGRLNAHSLPVGLQIRMALPWS